MRSLIQPDIATDAQGSHLLLIYPASIQPRILFRKVARSPVNSPSSGNLSGFGLLLNQRLVKMSLRERIEGKKVAKWTHNVANTLAHWMR